MTYSSSLTLFILLFLFGIAPGPGTFSVLACGLSQGLYRTLWLIAGLVFFDIAYFAAACLGLTTLANIEGSILLTIRISGGLYLIYLGWKMWQTSPQHTAILHQQASKWRQFLQGSLISATNPKIILFYIAFLPAFFTDLAHLTYKDVVLASTLALLASSSSLLLVVIAATAIRQYILSSHLLKNINRASGSAMIIAGLYLGLSG